MALFNKNRLERIAHSNRRICEALAQESVGPYEALGTYSVINENEKYDIFLSHSSKDKEAVGGLASLLTDVYKLSVYVDWINDPGLDRSNVTKDTAEILKLRMSNSACLFYVTSENAPKSKWMPWELGIMDALTGKVAICPLSNKDSAENAFNGQEYLGLYPYVDEISLPLYGKQLLIHNSSNKSILFELWLRKNKQQMYKSRVL